MKNQKTKKPLPALDKVRPGRKPLNDEKKEAITIYVKKTNIQHHGGKNALKFILTKVAESNVVLDAPAAVFSSGKTNHKAPIMQPESIQSPAPHPGNKAIQEQIRAIEAEKLPKERDTLNGRKSWTLDQNKRISDLKKLLQ